MKKINFTKMVASGNDFIVISSLDGEPNIHFKKLAQELCNRKHSIGADGLLVIEKSKLADCKMRIFNADGSEAEMCGNGARCVANFKAKNKKRMTIETKAGVLEVKITGEDIKIKLTDPKDITFDLPIVVQGRPMRVNFIDTGVPHTVILVSGIDDINVKAIGEEIRHHQEFTPKGTNVDFVEIDDQVNIKVRTYERGVEDETLACGTGAVASAIIAGLKLPHCAINKHKVKVHTKSGEILNVYFDNVDGHIDDAWLEGKAQVVYRGVIEGGKL